MRKTILKGEKKMKFDFGGYATKNDLQCSDGRTIKQDAFKDNDGQTVPLVWQHTHDNPSNVLGHALLENREDGVYAYCKFNDTDAGINTKKLVQHGDIKSLSIMANNLVQKGKDVVHGAIREVSLVLSGANPGALIDNLTIEHSDGTYERVSEEALIYTGLDITTETVEHSKKDKADKSDDKKEKTLGEVFKTFTDEQKAVVYAMITEASAGVAHSDDIDEGLEHSNNQGGDSMKRNIFEGNEDQDETTLTHADISMIFEDAAKVGSLKESVLYHAEQYGIHNIDLLFPDAKLIGNEPDWIKRRTEWVAGVISGTRKTPFSRIKTMTADITHDEARAKGYIKGSMKKEEYFGLAKRTTTPTTIYKKQKLDRDDIVDITDMNVVSWLKAEMRMMLDEEIARAILIGDGRSIDDPDKINEENIRPIAKEAELYAHQITIPEESDTEEMIEAIIRARKHYKGSGSPVFYTTTDTLTDMLLLKDQMGRRLYSGEQELKSVLRVSNIVEVPVMEEHTVDFEGDKTVDLVGILVNLKDYSVGADKGGEVSMFDDFDIDYNQYKYLMETRMSGALTLPKSALIVGKTQAGA